MSKQSILTRHGRIIQEIAKAQKIVLLIGNREITWHELEQIFPARRFPTSDQRSFATRQKLLPRGRYPTSSRKWQIQKLSARSQSQKSSVRDQIPNQRLSTRGEYQKPSIQSQSQNPFARDQNQQLFPRSQSQIFTQGRNQQSVTHGENQKLSTQGQQTKPIKGIPPEVEALREFRLGEQNQSALNLLTAMRKTRNFESSDVRDKIYALLGLTSDGDKICPIPNYVQPPRTIYFNTMKACLSRSLSLSAVSKFLNAENDLHDIEDIADADWVNLYSGVPGEMFELLGATEPRRKWGLFQERNWITLKNLCQADQCSNRELEQEVLESDPHLPNPLSQRRLTSSGLLSEGYIIDSIGALTTPLNLSEGLRCLRDVSDWLRNVDSGSLSGKAKTAWSLNETDKSSYESTYLSALGDFWDALFAGNFYCHCDHHSRLVARFGYARTAYLLTNLCRNSKWELISDPQSKEEEFTNWLVTNQGISIRGSSFRELVEGYSGTESYKTCLREDHPGSARKHLGKSVSKDQSDLLEHLSMISKPEILLASGLHEPVLGFVGSAAREGDLICKLAGTRAPVIVRRRGPVYQFVCETVLTVNPYVPSLSPDRQREEYDEPEEEVLQERIQEVFALSDTDGQLPQRLTPDENWRAYEELQRGGKPRSELFGWMVIQ